ncbi:efflux RND transporter periplasmic adaptor subunit [Novosphingobium olei]|uniref:Efflux RND transporter periplasmic adaptor subunit n=1 Tax=Novosphingobium olei TaxID=2728851 RepID=A0A7Y0BS83_9SPHN|nr:efflux RND transporter periplasmic adaptor subunit [Novosphingobium olei]NML95614.1 efflux RND transporter periplasmic adaptor subunit [Novosphingobium olei]
MNFLNTVPELSRKQQLRLLALAVAAVAAMFAAFAGIRALVRPKPVPVASLPQGEVQLTRQQMASVTIATARADDGVERTGASGQIAADETRSTPVFLPYSGQVLKVMVQNGDRVAPGAVLLRIRTSDIVDARNALFAAEAQRAGAAAQARTAADNARRAEEVYREAGGALKDLQQARSDLANAQAALRIADSAAAAARDKLVVFGKTPGEISRLGRASDIGGLHADTNLRAPIGGVVVTRSVADGQYVTSGGTQPAFVIADLSRVWLVAQVPETSAARIHAGDRVEVRTTALPGQTFDAVVDNVAAQIDPVSHRLTVRATIPNPQGLLKPQMFADFVIKSPGLKVSGQQPAGGASVPDVAVIHEGDSARVWVYLGNGRVVARPVITGPSHDGVVTIISGLRPGERIVTSGALFVNEAGLHG